MEPTHGGLLPYWTPLNRWTTKPAKPGHGQPCRGCYMVWTHRSLDMYRWHHPKHHSSPMYPFVHPPPFEEKVAIFCTHKMFSPVVDRDSGWAGGKGAGLSPKYHRDCDIRGQQEGKEENIMIREWFNILVILGNLEILEILDNFDILR